MRDEQYFIEQAEFIKKEDFLSNVASHPNENEILKKLKGIGAKLVSGPRGCGKTTLLLKAYYELLENDTNVLPVYVNYKNSLRIEPIYKNDVKATYVFKKWLILNIFLKMQESLSLKFKKSLSSLMNFDDINQIIDDLQLNNFGKAYQLIENNDFPNIHDVFEYIVGHFDINRIVILMDDAAHAFSVEQQKDFFEFFSSLRSKNVSPKAAIYPGVTNYSPVFHVGHDAEEVNVWVDPFDKMYKQYMRDIIKKRFPHLYNDLLKHEHIIDFFSYSSFGIPRAFLGMVYDHLKETVFITDINKVYKTSKKWYERNNAIFLSLSDKIPRYKEFIRYGKQGLNEVVENIKEYNKGRELLQQSVIIAIKKPIPKTFSKILEFYQYSGLALPKGKSSRGEKGEFLLYAIHYGLLADSNAIVVGKAKNIRKFNEAFYNRNAHAYTRITSEKLFKGKDIDKICAISLPNCTNCQFPRADESAKFCSNCGYQLTDSSVFQEIIAKDISVLPLTTHRVKKIKEYSSIKFISDIIIDNEYKELRKVDQIGPFWADKIYSMAEEFIS
jgi:archaellum biogenesis ATPase FlaH